MSLPVISQEAQGEGAYGSIFPMDEPEMDPNTRYRLPGLPSPDEDKMVAKLFHKPFEKSYSTFIREASLMDKMRLQPNIVKVQQALLIEKGESFESSQPCLVMKQACMDLSQFLEKTSRAYGECIHPILSELSDHITWGEQVIAIMFQLLQGVVALHQQGICHRDLRSNNILLFPHSSVSSSPFPHIEIADFSIATFGFLGYPLFSDLSCDMSPPELLDKDKKQSIYDPMKLDVWQIGLLFFECLTGRLLIRSTPISCQYLCHRVAQLHYDSQHPVFVQMVNKFFEQRYQIQFGYREPPPALIQASILDDIRLRIGDEGFQLLRQLLEPNPVYRLTAEQALDHPWFRKHSSLLASLRSTFASLPETGIWQRKFQSWANRISRKKLKMQVLWRMFVEQSDLDASTWVRIVQLSDRYVTEFGEETTSYLQIIKVLTFMFYGVIKDKHHSITLIPPPQVYSSMWHIVTRLNFDIWHLNFLDYAYAHAPLLTIWNTHVSTKFQARILHLLVCVLLVSDLPMKQTPMILGLNVLWFMEELFAVPLFNPLIQRPLLQMDHVRIFCQLLQQAFEMLFLGNRNVVSTSQDELPQDWIPAIEFIHQWFINH